MKTRRERLNQKIKKATFGYDDLLESLNQVKNMGGIADMLSMLPGVGSQLKNVEVDDRSVQPDRSNYSFHDTGGTRESGFDQSEP